MDVARIRRRPQIARAVLMAAAAIALVAIAAWTLPALYVRRSAGEVAISRDSLVIDTVTHGTLERSVTAAGVLVPDRVRIVATTADGIVAELPIRAGARVTTDTTIARLENPDLSVAVADASAQLDAARADVTSAREEAAAARLDEDAILRSARAESASASVEATSDTALHAQGLIGDLQFHTALIKNSEDRDLVTIANSKISVGTADADAKIAAAQARVDQFAAALAARRAQEATLVVTAGAPGIVQSVAVDPGQRVASGTELARIADDRDLKAVLQVAESDMRGVVPGLQTRIVASDGSAIAARVARIAPSAANGTVAVDVALEKLPSGARADQSVDGTIVIDRTANVLSIARPVAASGDGLVALYRLDRDGTHAYRTEVRLGSGSDERARVLSGLAAGDRVIVSDTSAYDAPTLRIQE
jgi:multidrug efflux pump subunit AcrA (membrane-fusion protein)